jgi:hypothetical protein
MRENGGGPQAILLSQAIGSSASRDVIPMMPGAIERVRLSRGDDVDTAIPERGAAS